MSHPASTARNDGSLRLPPELAVAGTGIRFGAWLLDSAILFLFGSGFGLLMMITGAMRENPAAVFPSTTASAGVPGVPMYFVNMGAAAAVETFILVFTIAYATICLHRFRGLPGQKALSLQVGDALTGRNLRLGQALARALVLYGLTGVSGLFLSLAMYYLLGTVPLASLLGGPTANEMGSWLGPWTTPLVAMMLFSAAWPLILLVSVAGDRHKQGLHDRLAGSVVAARAPMPMGWTRASFSPPPMPGYPVVPGYPPAAYPPAAYPPAAYPQAPGGMLGQPQSPQGGVLAMSDDPAALRSSLASDGTSSPVGNEPAPPNAGDRSRDGERVPPEQAPAPMPRDRGFSGGWGGNDPVSREPVWLHDDSSDKPVRFSSVGVGRRVGAYILDCVLIFMMFYLVLEVIALSGDPNQPFNEKNSIIAGLIGGVEQAFYFVGGWLVWGGTLGQKILHLEVSDNTTRKKLGFQDAFLRWTVMQGPFAAFTIAPMGLNIIVGILAVPWAGFLLYSAMSSPSGRGLHDRFVNSAVTQDY